MIRRSLSRAVLVANRLMGSYKEVVWVVGDGRSGTTWVADVINYAGRYRQMFEPFHPKVTSHFSFEDSWIYIRPEDEDNSLGPFARSVFRGELLHPRIDRYGRRFTYRGLLIKDIFTHLFMGWVDVRFPAVKKVLLLRHPCAIADSKEKIPAGRWMDDPRKFLLQRDLYDDFLHPFAELIRSAESFFERQITIWCVLHFVVLQQMKADRVHLLFYEDLCTDFGTQTGHLFEYLGKSQVSHAGDPRLQELHRTPSETVREDSAIRTGGDLVSGWKHSITPAQTERALEIMRGFGLGDIYDESGMPSREGAERLLQS